MENMDQVNHTRRSDQFNNSDHIASRHEDTVYYTSSGILPPPQYVITTKGRIIQAKYYDMLLCLEYARRCKLYILFKLCV